MKKKNRWSYEDCKRIIAENKEDTAYFDRSQTFDDMWAMFRFRFGFGEAETAVIIASLILSGANFK